MEEVAPANAPGESTCESRLAEPPRERHSMTRHVAASLFAPGVRVRHPAEPGWGIGQVQSVVGARVTVNFEHAGKRLINVEVVDLQLVDDGSRGHH